VNSLDVAFFMISIIFVTIGVLRGFVREVSALLAWALATLFAWIFADSVTGLFDLLIEDPRVKLIVAFIVVFLLVYIIIKIALYFMQETLLTMSFLKLPNKILGGVMAAAKSFFIILILVLLAGFTAIPEQRWWKSSYTVPYFQAGAQWLKNYLPDKVAGYIKYR